jgi:hypothetical protein
VQDPDTFIIEPGGNAMRDGSVMPGSDASRRSDTGTMPVFDSGPPPPVCPLTNLLANPGFESGLNPWFPSDGAFELRSTARSGNNSGRLCRNNTDIFSFSQELTLPLGQYVVRTFTLAREQTVPQLQVGLSSVNADAGVSIPSPLPNPNRNNWTCSESSFTSVGGSAGKTALKYTATTNSDQACVYFDDLAVYALPADAGTSLPPGCGCN